MSKWIHIILVALIVPVSVAVRFPPPPYLSRIEAVWILVWLTLIGGMAGYGLWHLGRSRC